MGYSPQYSTRDDSDFAESIVSMSDSSWLLPMNTRPRTQLSLAERSEVIVVRREGDALYKSTLQELQNVRAFLYTTFTSNAKGDSQVSLKKPQLRPSLSPLPGDTFALPPSPRRLTFFQSTSAGSLRYPKESVSSPGQRPVLKRSVSSLSTHISPRRSNAFFSCDHHMVLPAPHFNIEGSNRAHTSPRDKVRCKLQGAIDYAVHVDSQRAQISQWFRNHCMGKEYRTYYGPDLSIATICLDPTLRPSDSLKYTPRPGLIFPSMVGRSERYLVIHRTVDTTVYRQVSDCLVRSMEDNVLDPWLLVVKAAHPQIKVEELTHVPVTDMTASQGERLLCNFDDLEARRKFKVGLLMIKDGQTSEEEMYSNLHDSPRLEAFLDSLAQKEPLKGYAGWSGGLDTKNEESGEHFYTTSWNGFDFVFHVSTLMPLKEDKQQLQRKRHIGNGKTQFIHVFLVVRPLEDSAGYRVEVVSRADVPNFGPPLPDPPIFLDQESFRSFILAKIMNAEEAAFKAQKFGRLHHRARKSLLRACIDAITTYQKSQSEKPARSYSQDLPRPKPILGWKDKRGSLQTTAPTPAKSA